MTITLDNKEINLVITRKNNKNIYMQFIDTDTLEVRVNKRVSIDNILSVLKRNEYALIKLLHKKEMESTKDEFFNYLGKPYTIIFDEGVTKTSISSSFITTKNNTTLMKFYKEECVRVFNMELDRIAKYFDNIPFFTLKIRYMKTRWGVNNLSRHTITLNSELLKKDLDLIDYVIIHELCHFYEANHSPRFWEKVALYYPDYKGARKRLRD